MADKLALCLSETGPKTSTTALSESSFDSWEQLVGSHLHSPVWYQDHVIQDTNPGGDDNILEVFRRVS